MQPYDDRIPDISPNMKVMKPAVEHRCFSSWAGDSNSMTANAKIFNNVDYDARLQRVKN